MQTILRVWLLATAGFLGAGVVWAFVPVLVPIAGLTVGIGLLVLGVVSFARWIERLKGGQPLDG